MEITLTIQGAIPAEVREALRELYAQGTPGEPMEAQPVEVQEVAPKRRKIIGGKTWTDAEGETARVLYENGSNWREIASAINRTYGNNRTPDAVREYFKRLKAKED